MKKNILYLILFVLIATFSCSKENQEISSQIDRSISIENAKSWFDKNINTLNGGSRTNNKMVQDQKYLWSEAKLLKSKNGIDGVLLPFEYKDNSNLSLKLKDDQGHPTTLPVFQKVIIYKDKKGIEKANFVQYIHLNKNYLCKSIDEFDGWIIHSELNGTPIKAERWKSGSLLKSLLPVKPGARTAGCYAIDFGYDYSYVDEEGVFTIVHHYDWQWIGDDCYGGGGSSGGGGGGGGGSGDGGGGASGDPYEDPGYTDEYYDYINEADLLPAGTITDEIAYSELLEDDPFKVIIHNKCQAADYRVYIMSQQEAINAFYDSRNTCLISAGFGTAAVEALKEGITFEALATLYAGINLTKAQKQNLRASVWLASVSATTAMLCIEGAYTTWEQRMNVIKSTFKVNYYQHSTCSNP